MAEKKEGLGHKIGKAAGKAVNRADNGKNFDVMNPEVTNPNVAAAKKQVLKAVLNAGKAVAKAIGKLVSALAKALVALGPIGIIILIVLIIIVVIVAFNAMPGMMKSKLADLFNIDVTDWLMSKVQSGAVNALDPDYKDIVDVANYLESMNYSLIGDGFVTPILKTNSRDNILAFEDIIDTNPDYIYKVGDDNRYHFYLGSGIVDGLKYYNKYGNEISNSEGDYLSINDILSIHPEYKYEEGHIYETESNNLVDIKYCDNNGNVFDNTTGEMISNEVYMDEFGIIRSSTTKSKTANGKGELALFKEYYDNDDDIKNHAQNYRLIRSYLLSDYRIYTLKNDDTTFLQKLGGIFRTAFGGNQDGWAKGLMKLYVAKKGIVLQGLEALWNWSISDWGDSFTLTKTTLTLKKGFGNNPIVFSIEGWAPRYGMSLDFLLSLHLGTGAPDLVNAMLQNFDTEIQVYLDGYRGKVEAKYVDPNAGGGEATREALQQQYNNLRISYSDKKAIQLILSNNRGVLKSPSTCTNPDGLCSDQPATSVDEDGNTSVNECCSECVTYFKAILTALNNVEDQDYESYTPYIARVVGSWFRDTYFLIPDHADGAINNYANDNHSEFNPKSAYGNTVTFVRVDEQYLGDSGQYWTKYVTKDDGSYQLYFLNPNGTTSDITLETYLETHGYASQEEAEEDGWAFVKKAETVGLSQFLSEGHDSHVQAAIEQGYLDSRVLWTAYEFSGPDEDEWEKVKRDDDETGSVGKLYDIIYGSGDGTDSTGVFYKIKRSNTVTQYEDAQRGETNPLVKYLFKYRQFYIYDGSEERGLEIEHDRQRVLYGYDTYYNKGYDYVRDESVDNKGRYYLNKTVVDKYDIKDAMEADSSITAENFYTGFQGLLGDDGLLKSYYRK